MKRNSHSGKAKFFIRISKTHYFILYTDKHPHYLDNSHTKGSTAAVVIVIMLNTNGTVVILLL